MERERQRERGCLRVTGAGPVLSLGAAAAYLTQTAEGIALYFTTRMQSRVSSSMP